MERLGKVAGDISGILVTHEHSDHVSGVFRLARKYGLPVWLSGGTYKACTDDAKGTDCRLMDSHTPWQIGEFQVFPYPVPHDAREPVQFVFSDGRYRLGLLTDAGEVTAHMLLSLDGCDALVLEFNHDAELLANSAYPLYLKRRIAGRLGHLENRAAMDLLSRIDTSRLRHLVAAHLSERNNRPALVKEMLANCLGRGQGEIVVACPEKGFDWLELA